MNDLVTLMKTKPVISVRKPVFVQTTIVEDKNSGFDRDDLLERYNNSLFPVKSILDVHEKPAEKKKTAIKLSPVRVEPTGKKRILKKKVVGPVEVGAETTIEILQTQMYPKSDNKNIIASSYYMNNREKFVNFITALFEKYKREIKSSEKSFSCDDRDEDFTLLTHQKIVTDYMNIYTPYRGLLLYHGLGSGKTCTSIAIAEGMKNNKKIVVLTPASLSTNYMEELKKCGDQLYKKVQFWQKIKDPSTYKFLSDTLNLPIDFITKQNGAWFIDATKPSNFSELTSEQKNELDLQLNEMIRSKYTFINYNGLRMSRLKELTGGFKKNLFDGKVVVVDEAHNLISRIVNKIKKEKTIPENKRGEKEKQPTSLSLKLYEYLLRAEDARIVLLSGTPIINYPNEFGILFNILRGNIKTWKFTLTIKTSNKIDKVSLLAMLKSEKSLDYLDYSPANKLLTITRNPFGFDSSYDSGSKEYQGVSMKGDSLNNKEFEDNITNILKKNGIKVVDVTIENKKALPDDFESFRGEYIDDATGNLKNADSLKRRILGLSSYFKSAQESLLPRYSKILGKDYHIIRIPMSDIQFKIYESARKDERKSEKNSRKKKANVSAIGELYKEQTSTYRIFSRLYCNYVMPDRPMPILSKKSDQEKEEEKNADQNGGANSDDELEEGEIRSDDEVEPPAPDEKLEEVDFDVNDFEKDDPAAKAVVADAPAAPAAEEPKPVKKVIRKKKQQSMIENIMNNAEKNEVIYDDDDENARMGEIEGDENLEKIADTTYKTRIDTALNLLEEKSDEFLSPEGLETYSPKFLHMLDNINDKDHEGLHLVYSQFRTLEGIGIFSLVLKHNGFAQFKLKRSSTESWDIDLTDEDFRKPMFALYTGTESKEEKEIIRNIYNGDWGYIPTNIAAKLRKISPNNIMGDIIKVFMITSSGSEGINLRNTRYVHIMEPYWHPVRSEQVIGRARRICSHKDLPLKLQTVEVFVYLMIFSEKQLASDDAVELKRHDLSKGKDKKPVTSDQLLHEISEIKANLNIQLTDSIKETSFDCYIYGGEKCFNFGNPTSTSFSYVPDYKNQLDDNTTKINKQTEKMEGKVVMFNGTKYVAVQISDRIRKLYDYDSWQNSTKNPGIMPVLIATLEEDADGKITHTFAI
jgi:hypothetical protein